MCAPQAVAGLGPRRRRRGPWIKECLMAQPMKLGEVTISRVIEIDRSSFPTASMLPDSTAAEVAAHHHWLKPHFFDERTGDLASRIQTYVVRTPRHTILIDTGVGNDKARTGAPAWNMRQGTYLDDLAAVGVAPEQVDFVVCTHLHIDHVGWNTRWQDGRWVPTFPNARYVIAGAEYEFWKYESDAAGRNRAASPTASCPWSRRDRPCSSTAISRSASTCASSRGWVTRRVTSASVSRPRPAPPSSPAI
jgi:hypothetical protein